MWEVIREKIKAKSAQGVRSTKKDLVAVILGVIIVLFVANFLASRHFVRLDLTEGGEYTLSKSTKNILKGLSDVVNIRLYFSDKLPPAIIGLKRDVGDVLSEYKTYAGGKLNVQYINPQESPQMESQVQMMGIPPIQVNVIERDKQELVKVYLGMAIVHEDRKEVIPVVQGPGNLEYDLTSAILEVSQKKKPVVRWLASEGEDKFSNIRELLGRRYVVKDLKSGDFNLDSTGDSLVIIAVDKDLSDAELFLLDQYLMGGGKVIVLVDRVDVGGDLKTTEITSNVFDWIKANDIDVEQRILLDRSNVHAAFSGGYVTYHVPYPFWVKVGADGFDRDNPMVSDLDMLVFPWASPVDVGLEKPEGVQYTILAKSSSFKALAPLDGSLMPEEASKLLGRTATDAKPLAVLASGKLKSYFEEGGKVAPQKGVRALSVAENAELMVVGNSRFVQNNFLRQFAANSIFFENAVDFMAMGNELLGIRSKGAIDRPIKSLTPSKTAFVKYFDMLIAPLALVVAGLIILFLRRRRREVLRAIYKS